MRYVRIVLVAILALGFVVSTPLAGQRHRTRSGTHKSAPNCSKGTPCGNTCIAAGRTCHVGEAPSTGARDSHARIERSQSAKESFMRETGYPDGRPGHVVDHIVPLACGGADHPSNMQWQTVEEAKAKDRTERRGCSKP